MGEHTPTPWRVTEHDNGLVVRTTDHTGRPISSMWLNGESPQANAAFIVKACNAHDDLVAEVSELRALSIESNQLAADNFKRAKIAEAERDAMAKALEPFAKPIEMIECTSPHEYSDDDTWEVPLRDLRNARAALAKAKP